MELHAKPADKMNIFFDLDGTLLDSRKRVYLLFQHLVPTSSFSFDEYWNLKRNKINHQKILSDYFSYSENEIKAFEKNWMNLIEADEWLFLDQPLDGVTELLKTLSVQHNLYIVTARQFKSKVFQQIDDFGWKGLFIDALVTEQKKEKFELINEKQDIILNKNDIFAGDTGKDIETGKKLGIKTIAVSNGFLNEASLIKYQPDKIIDSVVNLNIE